MTAPPLPAAPPVLEAGFECSDMGSFHSSAGGGFGNVVTLAGDDTVDVAMAHGRFRRRTRREPSGIVHDVHYVSDTWTYDVVARLVLPGAVAAAGEIGGERVPFGSAIYHQHAVTELRLGPWRCAWIGAATLPPALRPEMYLRCEAGSWIVHARAMAAAGAVDFLKHVDGTAVPWHGSAVQRAALLRRRELVAPVHDTQVQPHVLLPAGLRITVGLRIVRADQPLPSCPPVNSVRSSTRQTGLPSGSRA